MSDGDHFKYKEIERGRLAGKMNGEGGQGYEDVGSNM